MFITEKSIGVPTGTETCAGEMANSDSMIVTDCGVAASSEPADAPPHAAATRAARTTSVRNGFVGFTDMPPRWTTMPSVFGRRWERGGAGGPGVAGPSGPSAVPVRAAC